NTDVAALVPNASGLTKTVELLGGGTGPATPTATVTERVKGGAGAPVNDMLILTVRATGGTSTLSYDLNRNGAIGTGETTAPIAFDASAEDVRHAIQKLLAEGDEFLELKFDVTVDRYITV